MTKSKAIVVRAQPDATGNPAFILGKLQGEVEHLNKEIVQLSKELQSVSMSRKNRKIKLSKELRNEFNLMLNNARDYILDECQRMIDEVIAKSFSSKSIEETFPTAQIENGKATVNNPIG